MTLPKLSRPWAWTYAALFLFFAFTRFYHLTARPLHNDEGVNGFFTRNLLKDNAWKYDPSNYHGPTLYYAQLLPSWVAGFIKNPSHFHFNDDNGLSVFSIRAAVACAGLLALAGFLCCQTLIGPWGALTALVLAGTSCDFLFYSRYFIHETYVVLFTFGFFLSLWWFQRTKRGRFVYGAALSAALLFATKETGVIHLLTLGAAIVGSRLIHRADLKTEAREAWRAAAPYLYPALLAAVVVGALLFSSFLKNPAGLRDAFTAYLPWTKQGVESGHIKAWSYFINEMLIPYELPLVVFTFIGTAVAFIKNEKRGLTLCLWTAFMIAAYSAIPYKTPWCLINFIFPMALTSGYGVQALIDWIRAVKDAAFKKRALAVVAAGVVSLTAFQWLKTWTINYDEYDFEQHKQVYVHTSRDIFRLLSAIESAARKTGDEKTIAINVVSSEYWPLPFYLKDYRSAKFWGKAEGVTPLDAPLLIAFPSQHGELKKRLHDSYSIQNFTFRPGVIMDLWINNTYMDGKQSPAAPLNLPPAEPPLKPAPGLSYELFEGATAEGTPIRVSKGQTEINFYAESAEKKPASGPFAVRWSGFLKIPIGGIYNFHLDSDDGSSLKLDNFLVIDNTGNHALTRKSRAINLQPGFHKLELFYNDAGGFAELNFSWTPPNQPEEPVPAQYFFSER